MGNINSTGYKLFTKKVNDEMAQSCARIHDEAGLRNYSAAAALPEVKFLITTTIDHIEYVWNLTGEEDIDSLEEKYPEITIGLLHSNPFVEATVQEKIQNALKVKPEQSRYDLNARGMGFLLRSALDNATDCYLASGNKNRILDCAYRMLGQSRFYDAWILLTYLGEPMLQNYANRIAHQLIGQGNLEAALMIYMETSDAGVPSKLSIRAKLTGQVSIAKRVEHVAMLVEVLKSNDKQYTQKMQQRIYERLFTNTEVRDLEHENLLKLGYCHVACAEEKLLSANHDVRKKALQNLETALFYFLNTGNEQALRKLADTCNTHGYTSIAWRALGHIIYRHTDKDELFGSTVWQEQLEDFNLTDLYANECDRCRDCIAPCLKEKSVISNLDPVDEYDFLPQHWNEQDVFGMIQLYKPW